jgi:hypothetical protein
MAEIVYYYYITGYFSKVKYFIIKTTPNSSLK